MVKPNIRLATGNAKLVWQRGELIAATGVCYKTLQNLEARGLLTRVETGLKNVFYTDESVQRLFGGKAVMS